MAVRIVSKRDLPSKRRFYNYLNALIQKEFETLQNTFPIAGSRTYNFYRNGQKVRNTGNMRRSFQQPGRIHVRGSQDKTFKSGSISLAADKSIATDRFTKAQYWDLLDTADYTGPRKQSLNTYKGFVKKSANNIRLQLEQFAAANRYNPYWLDKLTDTERQQMVDDAEAFAESLFNQAFGSPSP